MNWRPLVTALLGILLPLPLVGLLSISLRGSELGQPHAPRLNVVPMLTNAERQNMLTYGRKCDTDADCDPRLRCFFSMVTQGSCYRARWMREKRARMSALGDGEGSSGQGKPITETGKARQVG